VIAHNESKNLPVALESVTWADQIVVVDAGSTDNTAEIAVRFGAEVFREPNRKNLNLNKNIAIEHCKGDWIFILDADEEIPYDLAGEIRRIMNSKETEAGYLVPRRNFVMGKWLRRGSQYPDYQLRLFKRGKGIFAAKHVHERLTVDGKIAKLSLPFDHHPYPNYKMLVEKNNRYAELEAVYQFNQGKRISVTELLFQALLRVPLRFIRRYVIKGGFLDGVPGLIMAWFDISNYMLGAIRLWELSKDETAKESKEKST